LIKCPLGKINVGLVEVKTGILTGLVAKVIGLTF